MRRRPPVLSLTILALGAVLSTVAVAAPASAVPAGLQYVSLGDSYAAGFGITPSIPGPPDAGPAPASGCLQAEANYPHQVAAQLGLSLTDVTCTGATTANIIGTPQVTEPYFGSGGTAAPQSGALSADTDVVTVSIGGNDAGFSSVIAACVAFSATGPTFSGQANCQTAYTVNGVDTLSQLIQTTVAQNVAAAYARIRNRAPSATVFVVGYPSLLPDALPASGSCFTPAFYQSQPPPSGPPFYADSVPFTDVDVLWLSGIEAQLNDVLRTAAQNAGFTFIDNLPGSAANTVCPQSGDPYIEGITFRSLSLSDPPFTENGGMHPTASGISFLVAQVAPVIAAAFPDPAPAPAPVVPVLAVTGAEAGPTIALVAASALLIGAGAVMVVRSRRRERSARTPR